LGLRLSGGENNDDTAASRIPAAPAAGETPVVNNGPINVTIEIPSQSDDPTTPDVDEGTNTETFGDPAGTASGDLPEGENDQEYDYEVVTQQGQVTVETTENTVTTEYGKDDLDYIASETAPTGSNDLVTEKAYETPEEYLPGNQVGTPLDPDGPAEGEDWYQYEYMGTGNSSQFRPLVVFTEPMTPEQKIREYGDHPTNGAYINLAKLPDYFVGRLSAEEQANVGRNEDNSYKTDADGYLLDINGNRILKPEQTMTGPDGETYFLRRFDSQGKSAIGWYNDADWEDLDSDGQKELVPGGWLTELNGKVKHAAPWREAVQFVLVDKVTGEIITTYCADTLTRTEKSFGYHIENLENSTYYSDEEAAMIRSIAANGYWGTVGYDEVQKTDENGDPVYEMVIDETTGEPVLKLDEETGKPIPVMEQKAKAGSLEAMKVMLKEAGFSDDELASLTDGVALAATQMAIWSCSNKMVGVEFINANYYLTPGVTDAPTETFGAGGKIPAEKEDEVKLMFKLYDYLKNLAPTPIPDEEKTTENTIINVDNFLKGDMKITVLEKAEDHENNQDDDDKNDAYKTNLSFALVVQPSTENGDDLVVSVVNGSGEVIAKGRVAGDNSKDDSSFTGITDHGNGNYSFDNITMIEGSQEFNITMEGIQNLKEGVYLFTSEVEVDTDTSEEISSQTMVGMASGSHSVKVTQELNFSFDVEDEKVVVREKHKNKKDKDKDKEKDKEKDQGEETNIPDEDVPLSNIPEGEVPQVEVEDVVVIVDEDVPMTDLVLGDEEVSVIAETGDSNHMTGAFGGMFAALAGMFMLRKRKED
ncbi:Cys-Gln thioester bond-forming surface protein, partial [Anaerotignum sp.]